jgi:hypothetical protein
MSDSALIERIRSIFLHHEPRVTVAVAARLLGRSEAAMAGAIDDGVIETVTTCSGPMIDIRELAEEAVHTWPLVMIEEALGRKHRWSSLQTFAPASSRRAFRATSSTPCISSRRMKRKPWKRWSRASCTAWRTHTENGSRLRSLDLPKRWNGRSSKLPSRIASAVHFKR